MKRRFIEKKVEEALSDTPVVFLQGPRQSGKTTLVQSLQKKNLFSSYLTLDDAVVLGAAKSDPESFISKLPERVILDEIQRAPELFLAIKRNVDDHRKPGRFLLTGSANALLLPKVSESLAGRMEILRLWPFSQGEIEAKNSLFIDQSFNREFKLKKTSPQNWSSLIPRIIKGGFPEAIHRADDRRREVWFGSYITTLLERDIRDIANIQGLRELPHLLRLVAARSSNLVNFNDLARDAQIPPTTVKRYWALLEAIFLGITIPAWSGNLTSRLSKTAKLMIGDSGLLCYLLGITAKQLDEDPLMTGAILESFVGLELSKQITWSETQPKLFHYRTHAQAEVDFVLEDRSGGIVGIEVKKNKNPSSSDFKGLRQLAEVTGKKFIRGILLYTGQESVAFDSNLFAIPISSLWDLLSADFHD